MTRFLAALFAVALAATAHAQSVQFRIDPASFGAGWVDIHPVDTDGLPWTDEWAVHSLTTQQWRVVTIRDGHRCDGPWFRPDASVFGRVALEKRGSRHVLIVTESTGLIAVISLDTPTC